MSWADDGDELLLVPTSHQGRYHLICAWHSVKAERCAEFVIGQKEKCSNVYNLIILFARLPNSFKQIRGSDTERARKLLSYYESGFGKGEVTESHDYLAGGSGLRKLIISQMRWQEYPFRFGHELAAIAINISVHRLLNRTIYRCRWGLLRNLTESFIVTASNYGSLQRIAFPAGKVIAVLAVTNSAMIC